MFGATVDRWMILALVGVSIFTVSYHYNKQFLDWLRFQSLGTRDYIVERLQMMFIDIPAHKILAALFAMSIVPGVLIFLLMVPHWIPATVFGAGAMILGWKLPKPVVDWLYRKRVDRFTSQMVDGLNLMSNGMKSGLSVVQAMGLVVSELPNPIRQEFNVVLNENKLGIPLEEALNNLGKRIKSDDVEMFVTAINILKETGGNLAETFDTISSTIRERVKVQKKIESMTAQGFFQGMVLLAMVPALGVVFYQTDPEFMKPLFSSTMGWFVVAFIFVLEIVTFFVIMKIVKINV
jgi:tight adherence protein B